MVWWTDWKRARNKKNKYRGRFPRHVKRSSNILATINYLCRLKSSLYSKEILFGLSKNKLIIHCRHPSNSTVNRSFHSGYWFPQDKENLDKIQVTVWFIFEHLTFYPGELFTEADILEGILMKVLIHFFFFCIYLFVCQYILVCQTSYMCMPYQPSWII